MCMSNYSRQQKLEHSEYNYYLCHIYNVSSLSEPTVFQVHGDSCCTCRARERNGTNTNTNSLLFQQSRWLHQNAWFNFDQIMLKHRTCLHCVQNYRRVRCMIFPQSTSHFFVDEAHHLEAGLSSGWLGPFGPSKLHSMSSGYGEPGV